MIYLEIAYSQMDEAKPFGVRWDPKKKLWYFPGDVLPEELERFRPAKAREDLVEKIILDIPFGYRDIAAKAGARWNSENKASLRAKFSVKLYGSAKMIFWLSATAGQNPLELGYLAPILAKKTGDRALTTKDFGQWCIENLPGVSRGKFGAWAWAGGKEEEEEVHQLLFDPEGIRPEKLSTK
jgi:hypothetical protein